MRWAVLGVLLLAALLWPGVADLPCDVRLTVCPHPPCPPPHE